jgi:cytochrome c oxidase cbb3-type subunit 3
MRVVHRMLLALTVLSLAGPQHLLAQAGPNDRQLPDAASVERGLSVYAAQCINCHGLDVKGTEDGPDLIRSVAVLRDFEGSEIGPTMSALGHLELSPGELVDLSHFLKQQIEATARNRNALEPPDILTGDVARGGAYFSGEGGCTACHAIDGDLRGIGSRYSPLNLQQRFLFPRDDGVPSEVRVSLPSGETHTGQLEFVDDFFVSLTDASGVYRSFRRSPGIEVEVEDPRQAHWDLLDRITDAEIHDVVTYLETIQ